MDNSEQRKWEKYLKYQHVPFTLAKVKYSSFNLTVH